MSGDADMFQAAKQGTAWARVYRWDGLWVSLGRYQVPETALVNPSTTPWVMRPTGGAAVVHGADLTISIACPLELLGFDERQLRRIYRAVSEPIIRTLNLCGLPAALAEDTEFVNANQALADCFASKSRNDVVDPNTGQKVCGCALTVGEGAVLIQASIPYAPAIRPISEVVRGGVDQLVEPWAWELALGTFAGMIRDIVPGDGNDFRV